MVAKLNWNKYSKIFFIALAVINILAQFNFALAPFLRLLTKPMLMPALAFVFFTNTRRHFLNNMVYLALFFAFLGDVFLMFGQNSKLYFGLGLGSFLVMQLLYVYIFKGLDFRLLKPKLPYALAVVLFGVLVLYFVLPSAGLMLIPVLLYFFAILAMVLAALGAWQRKNTFGAMFTFVGAVLFMVSDSLIALNKFYDAIPLSGFLIMLSYTLAQYLIIYGLTKR
jgi:uncharacterized membrane protein YhhN